MGRPHLSVGGVARNLATALQYLGHEPYFLTALARDNLANLALDQFKAAGFLLDGKQLKISWQFEEHESQSLSSCFALVLMDSIKGQCEYVIANLDAVKAISPQTIEKTCMALDEDQATPFGETPILVMDANLRADTMECIVRICHRERVPIFLEPTDVVALPRLVSFIKKLSNEDCLTSIACLSPNLLELQRMVELFGGQEAHPVGGPMSLDAIERMANYFMVSCMPELTCLLVTLDKRGLMVAIRTKHQDVRSLGCQHDDGELDELLLRDTQSLNMNLGKSSSHKSTIRTKHFKPLEVVERPISASGAGDSFAAGFISGLIENRKLSECIHRGLKASNLALNAIDTIPSSLKSLNTS